MDKLVNFPFRKQKPLQEKLSPAYYLLCAQHDDDKIIRNGNIEEKKNNFSITEKNNNLKQKLSTFRFCDKSIFICSCAVRNCGLFWAVLFCFSTLKADRHQWKWKQIVYNMYLSYTCSPSFWTYKSNFSVGRSSVGYLRAHCLWMQMFRVCTISGQKKWKVKTTIHTNCMPFSTSAKAM